MKLKINLGLLLCAFVMMFGWSSCSNDLEDMTPVVNDDASLVKAQLELLKKQTKAQSDATNTILVTTKATVNFTVKHNSDIVVDWGDGASDINVFSHTYTDNLPVHTILFYGRQDAINELLLNSNEIIFVDITKNTTLEYFQSYSNRFTRLDVASCSNLKRIMSINGHLTSLDLTNNVMLEELECSFNEIKNITIPQNSKLKIIGCYSNKIIDLDVSNCLELTGLHCEFNNIKVLDVTHNANLDMCQCANNQITSLDFSNNLDLRILYCSNNPLTSLDITQNSKLQSLSCFNTDLDDLKLPNPSDSKLSLIYCNGNKFSTDPDKMMNIIRRLPNRYGLERGTIYIDSVSNFDQLKKFADYLYWDCIVAQ